MSRIDLGAVAVTWNKITGLKNNKNNKVITKTVAFHVRINNSWSSYQISYDDV